MKLISLLLEHWKAVAGLIGTVFALFTSPPRIRRPVPSTIAKDPTMSFLSNLEAKLHEAADKFSIHGSIETLKADLSAVYAVAKPVLTLGAQALTPIAAQAAQEAIAAKIGGPIGETLGADAAALITAEGAKIGG